MTSGLLTLGFSDAAEYIQEKTLRGRRDLYELNAFGIGSKLQDELNSLWEECCKPNWDGYQALPVSWETVQNARRFLESLPLEFPAPSLGAEPDGDLTAEWHRSAQRTLSISITADGDLHFAARLGPNRVYGTEAFFGEAPERILDLIRRIYAA